MADSFGLKIGVEGEKEFKKSLSDINQSFKILGSEMKLVESQFDKNDTSVNALTARNEVLNKQIEAQREKIDTLRAALDNAATSFGESDRRTQNWQIQLNNAEAALNSMEKELKNNTDAIENANAGFSEAEDTLDSAGKEMDDVADSADDMGKEVDDAGKSAEKSEGRFKGLTSTLKAVGAAMAAVVVAAGAAAVKLGKEVVAAYADYEQLVGGVETLFKDSSDEVQKYASNAYKTAGLSANQYMETVTGFSASLISSLEGDTEKAAKKADMAITDMSDNANKMGTDIQTVMSAYSGFAKGQFQLLDNLKLGYGGTKTEMERLLKDAQALSGIEYNIDSYADIVDAIHVIQTEMGITGTTAREAESTITGSINMTKSAFQNLIAGLGDADADIEKLCTDVVQSFTSVLKNIKPVIENLVKVLPFAISSLLGAVSDLPIVDMLVSVAQAIMTSAPSIIHSLASNLISLLPEILSICLNEVLPDLVSTTFSIIEELVMTISGALPDLLVSLSQGLISVVTNLFSGSNIQKVVSLLLDFVNNLLIGLQATLPIIHEGLVQLALGILESAPAIFELLLSSLPGLIDSICLIIQESTPLFIQSAISLCELLTAALPQIISSLCAQLPSTFSSIVSLIVSCAPMLIDGACQLVLGLVSNLGLIIKSLLAQLPSILKTICSVLSENLPILVSGAIDLVLGVCQNLPLIIEEFLRQAPFILESVCSALLSALPILVQGGISLVVGVVSHLPEILFQLLKSAPQIISSLAQALLGGLGSIIDVGINIVRGLWDGICSAASWLWNQITGWMNDIWNGICNFFGIASPSKKFRDGVGKNLVKGLALGIRQEEGTALKAVQDMADDISAVTFTPSPVDLNAITDSLNNAIPADFDKQFNASVMTGSAFGDSSGYGRSPVINTNISFGNVTINNDSDVEDIAHQVSDIIVSDIMIKGGAYA